MVVASAFAGPPAAVQPFIERHCLACHDGATREAELDLESLRFRLDDEHTLASWIKIYERVEQGEMPPKKKPRPDQADVRAFLEGLRRPLVDADRAQQAAVGRTLVRRLNRQEYEATLRDVLHAPWLHVADSLPEDGEAHHFNKVSEALDMSHVRLTRYLSTAETALRAVMASQVTRPENRTVRYYAREQDNFVRYLNRFGGIRRVFPVLGTRLQAELMPKDAPRPPLTVDPVLREREAMAVAISTYQPMTPEFGGFRAPVSGRYRLRFSAYTLWMARGYKATSRGRRVEPVSIYAIAPRVNISRKLGSFDVGPDDETPRELEVWLAAGETIRPDAARLPRPRVPPFRNPIEEADGMPLVAYRWMEVDGPLLEEWPTRGHQLLFGDLPLEKTSAGVQAVSMRPEDDARNLLKTFLGRVGRRPWEPEEEAHFLGIIQNVLRMGQSFTDAMLAGYAAVLSSPGFLYLAETPGPLDDYALAVRLSYFLTNSAPDEELRTVAQRGGLKTPSVLRAQTERLLSDARSQRFVESLLDYWLDLRHVANTAPDIALYPDHQLDDLLIESAMEEPRLYFAELLRRNLGIRHIVASDFAILNERLALHYGIPGVEGVAMRSVPLPAGSVRGGLLTQAAVLKVTANGTATSPVVRGAWIMARILGQPSPPPPPNTPGLEPDTRGATTIRKQLEVHRNEASCAACHAKIDPPGFALENFDVMGAWRDRYRSLETGDPVEGVGHSAIKFAFKLAQHVDATGHLADGRTFRDVREFKQLLLADEDQLARNLVRQLLVYATGASPRFADREAVEAILDATRASEHGVRSLVHAIVQSELFQTK